MGRDVRDVVAMIVGDVVVDVVGARKILAKTSSFSMLDYVCWIKFQITNVLLDLALQNFVKAILH